MSEPWTVNIQNLWKESPKPEDVPAAETKKPASGASAPWLANIVNSWFPNNQAPQKKVAPAEETGGQFDRVFNRLIQAESRGKHVGEGGTLTTSPVGAQGITQLMPKTAKDPGYGIEPVKDQSEGEYLRVGRSYFKAMLTNFDGDYEKALAAYNAGSRNVRTAITKATKAGDASKWREYLPRKQETNPYIDKIMKGITVEKKTKFQERNLDMVPGYEGNDAVFNQGLGEVLTEAKKIPEFNTMQSFLKKVGAVPKLEREFSDENLGSFTYGGKSDPGTIQTITGAGASATVIHEMVHASTRQFRAIADDLSKKRDLSKDESQFLDMFKKTLKYDWNIGEVGDRNSKGIKDRSGLTALARTLDAQWFEKNKEYRASPEELPAHGLGNQFKRAKTTSKEHMDATAATEFMMLLEMANKLKGK